MMKTKNMFDGQPADKKGDETQVHSANFGVARTDSLERYPDYYLDFMPVERGHCLVEQNPLTILQVDHKLSEAEKMQYYEHKVHTSLFCMSVLILSSTLLLYLNKRKSKKYNELVCKSRKRSEQAEHEMIINEDIELIARVHEMMLGGLYKDNSLTLESLAALHSVHRNTMSKAINRVTGKRFNQFVNEYRIQEAIRLIEETPKDSKNLYIVKIYEVVGFNSPASFFRAFRQTTGLSPCTFWQSKSGRL